MNWEWDIDNWFVIVCIIIAFKSITIGSDFNFMNWFKYGKDYRLWYFKRHVEEYKPNEKENSNG